MIAFIKIGLLLVHIVACLFVMFYVLIQSSKGGGLGAAFGDGETSLGGGANQQLRSNTWRWAIILMVTAFFMGLIPAAERKAETRQRLNQLPSEMTQEMPAPIAGEIPDNPNPIK